MCFPGFFALKVGGNTKTESEKPILLLTEQLSNLNEVAKKFLAQDEWGGAFARAIFIHLKVIMLR